MSQHSFLHKRGIEFSLNFIITVVIALVALAIILAFWNVLYKAIVALPG